MGSVTNQIVREAMKAVSSQVRVPKIVIKEEYYIQNGYVGNAILWWAEGSKGYTTDFKQAGRYSKEVAIKQANTRPEDRAWPCDYIDGHEIARVTIIDGQYLDHDKCERVTKK